LNVIRIFESNVLMFMQTNTLSSSNELRRSGRLVYKKTLHLDKDPSKDIRKWEDYSIDLSGLINQEPGAIYRITLSNKPIRPIHAEKMTKNYNSPKVRTS